MVKSTLTYEACGIENNIDSSVSKLTLLIDYSQPYNLIIAPYE